MEATLLVVLGWLLGIVGGPIAERIRRKYSANDLKKACLNELLNFRYSMASLVQLVHSKMGTLNHEILDWVEPIEQHYQGPDKDPLALTVVQKLKALPPTELEGAMAIKKAQFSAMTAKQYSLSFIDSQMASLSILPIDLRLRILQVKDQLAIFNQDVTFVNSQLALTYQNLGSNRGAVVQTLTDGYQTLASRARQIADAITAISDRYS